jgi:acyl-coenzyme A thioesterase PaaI-like protein
MRIDYLVPGKGTHFIASGNILRVGNKIGVVRSELRNELNELIAVGTGTFLVG